MNEGQNQAIPVDVVMCVDVTMSMAPVLNEIRKTILTFFDRFRLGFRETGFELGEARMKVIAFRDYGYDSEPLQESPFYTLPKQKSELRRFLDSLEAYGGVENYSGEAEPACALEAMSMAFKSEWTLYPLGRHRLVFVFTDAPAWRLWERAKYPGYPQAPGDLDRLRDWWYIARQKEAGAFKHTVCCLLVLAPEIYPWNELQDWEECEVDFCPLGSLTPSFVRKKMDELFEL